MHRPHAYTAGNGYFNPHNRLSQLPIFRWVLATYTIVITTISSTILLNSGPLHLDLSATGFEYLFFELLKTPLYIIGSMLAIIALIASIHRSEQSKEQMFIAMQQNTFSNYYKRLEEFDKYIERRIDNVPGRFYVVNPRELHEKIWPGYMSADTAPNEPLLRHINEAFVKINNLFNSSGFDIGRENVIKNICNEINFIFNTMLIKPKRVIESETLDKLDNQLSKNDEKIYQAITIAANTLGKDLFIDFRPNLYRLSALINELAYVVEEILKFDTMTYLNFQKTGLSDFRIEHKSHVNKNHNISVWCKLDEELTIRQALSS